MTETWVLDVDGTVIDSQTGSSLRPQTHALLVHLRKRSCTVVLWSAGGSEYPRHRRAEQHGLGPLVHAFHAKAGRDACGRYVVHRVLEGLDGAVFVDDRPEDMPIDAEVVSVSPYIAHDPHDRGLRPALERAGLDSCH